MQASAIAHGLKYTDFKLRLFVIRRLAPRCFSLQPFATVRPYRLSSLKLDNKNERHEGSGPLRVLGGNNARIK